MLALMRNERTAKRSSHWCRSYAGLETLQLVHAAVFGNARPAIFPRKLQTLAPALLAIIYAPSAVEASIRFLYDGQLVIRQAWPGASLYTYEAPHVLSLFFDTNATGHGDFLLAP
ncbi:hypothetical protein LshimejAT787_0801420 [Lyophyllum shimeji]|uniref:Uncharacterized protein n=1 Tax=Lyophyllum shimeji TaxID=47721 RepID=A0A9P3URJ3_LYOSH|nr:hypothetical protein LshimejAT787_0801420 [Lyophyllum shimeji]